MGFSRPLRFRKVPCRTRHAGENITKLTVLAKRKFIAIKERRVALVIGPIRADRFVDRNGSIVASHRPGVPIEPVSIPKHVARNGKDVDQTRRDEKKWGTGWEIASFPDYSCTIR